MNLGFKVKWAKLRSNSISLGVSLLLSYAQVSLSTWKLVDLIFIFLGNIVSFRINHCHRNDREMKDYDNITSGVKHLKAECDTPMKNTYNIENIQNYKGVSAAKESSKQRRHFSGLKRNRVFDSVTIQRSVKQSINCRRKQWLSLVVSRRIWVHCKIKIWCRPAYQTRARSHHWFPPFRHLIQAVRNLQRVT